MKETIPNYNKTPTIQVFQSFKKNQQDIINDFMKYCEITSTHIPTQKKIKAKIITFFDVMEKDISQIDLEDLRLFLAVLKNSTKSKDYKSDLLKQIKRFLIWKFEDYPKRFSRFDDILRFSKGNKKKKLEAEDLFTTEEVNFILKEAPSIKLKTIIAVLYESGARPEEILNLTFGKVNFDKGTITVFSNKTQQGRLIPLDESMSHLKRFKEETFTDPKNTDYLFVNHKTKAPMTSASLSNYFARLETQLKLKKKFYPYILRHSRLNFLRKKLSPDTYEAVSGHSMQVAMSFYKHLDKDAIIEEMQERIFEGQSLSTNEVKELKEEMKQIKNQMEQMTEFTMEKMGFNPEWAIQKTDELNDKINSNK